MGIRVTLLGLRLDIKLSTAPLPIQKAPVIFELFVMHHCFPNAVVVFSIISPQIQIPFGHSSKKGYNKF